MQKIEPFQIKKIYAVGHALGIVKQGGKEDELHALVAGVTGKDSIRTLSYHEAAAVITRLEELQGGTASVKRNKVQKSRTDHKERPGGVTAGQQRKIWALMYELKKYDKEPNRVQLGERLCAVIKKELGTDALAKDPFAWISFSQGNTLIEVLKGYVENEKRKEGRRNGSVG